MATKQKGVDLSTFLNDFFEMTDGECPPELRDLFAIAVAYGIASGLDAVFNGYEHEDGSFEPVIASDLAEQAYGFVDESMNDAGSDSEPGDEDGDGDDTLFPDGTDPDVQGPSAVSGSGSGMVIENEVFGVQAELENQVREDGNAHRQGWANLPKLSRKKAN